jgi:hypothetical protein
MLCSSVPATRADGDDRIDINNGAETRGFHPGPAFVTSRRARAATAVT